MWQMKAIRIFVRNVKNGLKSITRNFSLSAASVICTTITLSILAIAMILSANINSFTKELEGTLSIIVYVDKNANEDEIAAIKSKILDIKNVKNDELLYKSKEDIKQEQLKKTEKDTAIYKIMESWTEKTNPLEPEFIITLKELSEVKDTVNTLNKIDNVSTVQYSEDIIDKMLPIFNVIEKVTIIIIGGLILVTIFLIWNTIKITIFARRNEIEIMRLVGTSNFVIKLPFVIEGLFLGLIGSIIPIITAIWGYIISYDKLEGYLFTNIIKMIEPMPFVLSISFIILIIGGTVGMVGSYSAVRKYLKI